MFLIRNKQKLTKFRNFTEHLIYTKINCAQIKLKITPTIDTTLKNVIGYRINFVSLCNNYIHSIALYEEFVGNVRIMINAINSENNNNSG